MAIQNYFITELKFSEFCINLHLTPFFQTCREKLIFHILEWQIL